MDAAPRLRERAALPGRVRRRRRAPRRLHGARRPGEVPDHDARRTCATNYPFGMFAVPQDQVGRIHASSGTTGRPTVVGYTARRHRHLGRRSWRARSGPPAGGRATSVHVAYGYGLFTGGLGAHYGAEKLGCTVIPISGGMTDAPGPADPRLRARRDHGDAQLHAHRSSTRSRSRASTRAARRWRSASSAPSRGPSRCAREIEERLDIDADRHLRPVRGDGPGRRAGVRGDQGRPAHLGGPLLPGDHRPGHRRGAARRRAGRAGLHVADQGGHAGHPVPHPRPHPAAAGHRAAGCGAWRRSPAAPTT